jgi:hypothetical protein
MGCGDTSIVGNTTRGGKDGMFVGDDPSNGITITGNAFNGPQSGVRVPNTYDALRVTGSNRVVARNNVAYGNARYAVGIVGGGGMTVTGTRWRSIGTGGVSDGANATELADNLQF